MMNKRKTNQHKKKLYKMQLLQVAGGNWIIEYERSRRAYWKDSWERIK